MRDLAHFEHIAVIGRLQRGARILLDQQNRHAELTQRRDDAQDLPHHDRRKPEARLIEQQKPRLRHQRAAERQHLPLAARQCLRLLPPALVEPGKTRIDLLQALLHIGSVTATRVAAQQKVVGNRHVAEQFAGFRHQTKSALDTLLDVEPLDIERHHR